jgi:hypothetical protein
MKPYCGMAIVYKGRSPSSTYNGHDTQPGLITTSWGASEEGGQCVNVKVLPDCGAPFDATSCFWYPNQNLALTAFDGPMSPGGVCWPASRAEAS